MTISDEMDCSVALEFDWEGRLLKDHVLSYLRPVTASYTLGLSTKGLHWKVCMFIFVLFLYFQHCPTLIIINASTIDVNTSHDAVVCAI